MTARRRIARSGWQGPNRRSTLIQNGIHIAGELLVDKLEKAKENMERDKLQAEIHELPTQQMMPLESLYAMAFEARNKGFARGFGWGLVVAGFVSLLTVAILMATGCDSPTDIEYEPSHGHGGYNHIPPIDAGPAYHPADATNHTFCPDKGHVRGGECCPVDAAPGWCESPLKCVGIRCE